MHIDDIKDCITENKNFAKFGYQLEDKGNIIIVYNNKVKLTFENEKESIEFEVFDQNYSAEVCSVGPYEINTLLSRDWEEQKYHYSYNVFWVSWHTEGHSGVFKPVFPQTVMNFIKAVDSSELEYRDNGKRNCHTYVGTITITTCCSLDKKSLSYINDNREKIINFVPGKGDMGPNVWGQGIIKG